MGFHQTLLRFITITSFSLLAVACANKTVQEADLPEQEYYQKAQAALEDGLPTTAVKHLKDLTNRYPFGEYTVRAELDLIYAYISAGDFIAAHANVERFIKNHPDHSSLDYAYYMRALSTYKSTESFLGRYLALDPSERDVSELTTSFNEFSLLVKRFPDSQYAPDSKARMVYLRNIIARHEIQVAKYYFKRNAPLSSLRRGQAVLEQYPSSDSVEDALAIVIQAYMDLEQYDFAQNNIEFLIENFPSSSHLDKDNKFITSSLPKDADPDFLYWVTLGAID
jgi:outer membrane protein assembly factor BamD